MTAQKTADIQSKAIMLRAKLDPANANIVKITMRSRKRTTTWMDCTEPGKFFDGPTNEVPNAVAHEKLSQQSGS